ncbi:MAG TPA: DNA cytosine methyltransferase [Pyrinomonadaceae bacterium]|jgi:DNA (cytosine-5)-methyltransferase 1
MDFRLGELFCGAGGIGYAAKKTRFKTDIGEFSINHAWSTDFNEDACKTYRRNICPDAPETVVHEDIRKLDFSVLAKISSINALAFGFPCNDFSSVGEKKGIDGVFGALYSYGVRALERFTPQWFLAENVGGLRNSNDGRAFKQILHELSKDYDVVPHLYKFEKYGVPQARHRIIIIGTRKDLGLKFKVPSPAPFADADVSARTALTVPPIPFDAANQERTNQSQSVMDRLSHIKPGENAWTADIPANLRLNVKSVTISSIYRRLDPDKPAYTVTGSGGGGTHVYHWEENRALTNRERARLQTFPDDFVFEGSKESVRKQIGMAVPPKGVSVIFEAVLKTFAGIDYLSIPHNIELDKTLFDDSDSNATMPA